MSSQSKGGTWSWSAQCHFRPANGGWICSSCCWRTKQWLPAFSHEYHHCCLVKHYGRQVCAQVTFILAIILWYCPCISPPPGILKPTEQEALENRNNVLLVLDTEHYNSDKPAITTITQWDESPQNSGNLLACNYLKPVICAMKKTNGVLWSLVLLFYVKPACIFVTNGVWYLWHAVPFSPCMLLQNYHPKGLASVAMWYALHYKFVREWMVVSQICKCRQAV